MSAPNLKEIEWAIAELEKEESSFPVYAKLASLYTVRNEMIGLSAHKPQIATYSEAAWPEAFVLGRYGDSEFLRAAEGKDPSIVLSAVDDLMSAIQMVRPNAYANVMRAITGA